MKKLQDAVENVRYGSVLTINKEKYTQKKDGYNSCISLYDGRIFKDVKSVELGDFLSVVPNIACQLDQGYIYQVKYLSEERKYQSTIMHYVREGGYKELDEEETVNDFEVISDSFLDGIIALDTKIADFGHVERIVQKKKKITIA